MKPNRTYTLNERAYTAIHPLTEELSFDSDQPFVFDLAYLSALEIMGDNALSFLQGQISSDLNDVTANQMRPGAICNLQGRLMALLDVIQWQGVHLILPQDLLELTASALSKAALFSRVTLKPNPSFSFLGYYTPSAKHVDIKVPTAAWESQQTEDSYCYAISDKLFIIMLDTTHKDALLAQFPPTQHRGSLAWHYLELQQPRFSLYPNTRGLFLPHRLGLQDTPYLSFNKGCYKGQEVIARMHYRAKLKHEVKSYYIETAAPIFSGQKMYAKPQASEIGEVIDYCPVAAETYLILSSVLLERPSSVYFDQHQDAISLGD
ncbi:MAG: folate-binding protein YgfZ [Gammaproteobacteria bacterium]|nr:folate-binding protein YgfZ [Gammaproteobacteria bacterium]